MTKGYVYVLSNPSMPGLVKIGRSVHGGQKRSDSLNTTGVPQPFELEFEIYVDDPEMVEQAVHRELCHSRLSDSREFFRAAIADVIAAILSEVAKEVDHAVVHSEEYDMLVDVQYMSDACDLALADLWASYIYLPEQSIRAACNKFRAALLRSSPSAYAKEMELDEG